MEKENTVAHFEIKQPEYKTFKVNQNSIESTNDLANILFAIIGNAIRVDINAIPDDRKKIIEKHFVEV